MSSPPSRRPAAPSSSSDTTSAAGDPNYKGLEAKHRSSEDIQPPGSENLTSLTTERPSGDRNTSRQAYRPDRSTRQHPKVLSSLFRRDAVDDVQILENHPQQAVPDAERPAVVHRQEAARLARAGLTREDLLGRIQEAIRKAKEYHDESERLGKEILELEADIKAVGHSTPDKHRKLDSLYRELMRHSESEKKVHDEEDIMSNIAILSAMKASDEPAPRNGGGKARKNQKQILESDVVVDSPVATPAEPRGDILKRVKGASQRSSSVASQSRATSVKEEAPETKVPGMLQVGTEVFYKLQAADIDEGVGQHQIIKRVVQDKKLTLYDLKDPEKGETSRKGISPRHLAVIPQPTQVTAPIFLTGSRVYARYPDTDTFYEAEVRNYTKGQGYALLFEGEEETYKEHLVERRYVFDPSRWK